MFARFAISSLLLVLLSGCADASYLLGGLFSDRPEVNRAPARYTQHAAAPAVQVEVVTLRIADTFNADERSKIMRAVTDWNIALNGAARFDVGPNTGLAGRGPQSWTIMPAKDQGLRVLRADSSIPLAVTQPIPGGGVMLVHVDRIGWRDLGGVMMHELGHVLGLGHDPRGGLMATHYHPADQHCVDKAAVQAVASRRGLPVDRFNWCEAGVSIAAR